MAGKSSQLELDAGGLAFLSATRSEMYCALDLFHRHVQHTISLQLGMIGAATVLVGLAHRVPEPPRALLIFAGVGGTILLWSVPVLARRSRQITYRYYRLYVTALLYAADLHESAGLGAHDHFLELRREQDELEERRRQAAEKRGRPAPQPLRGAERVSELVVLRTHGKTHTWSKYVSLTRSFVWAGMILGTLLAAFTLWIAFSGYPSELPRGSADAEPLDGEAVVPD